MSFNRQIVCFIFMFQIILNTQNNDEINFNFPEFKRIKIKVESGSEVISKKNPFNNDLIYILTIIRTDRTNKIFNFELYIASFKTKVVQRVDSPVTNILNINSDVFWVKDYIVLIDQSLRKYYFWNNSAQSLPPVNIPQGYDRLIINEYYPNMLISISQENNKNHQVSNDFGRNYYPLLLGSKEFHWIFETHLLAFTCSVKTTNIYENTLYIQDFSSNSMKEILKAENILNYKIVDQYIFFITSTNRQVSNNYSMFDASTNILSKVLMPENYLNPRFYSIFYDDKFIFTTLKSTDKTCLLRSMKDKLKFYSLICNIKTFDGGSNCEFSFSKKPHVIYVNVNINTFESYQTIYSRDDGDNWKRFEVRSYGNNERFEYKSARLKLECIAKRNINLNPRAFEIFYGSIATHSNYYLVNYYSKDIGIFTRFESNSKRIEILKYDEMLLSTPHVINIIHVYYKVSSIYRKFTLQNNEIMSIKENFIHEESSNIISIQLESAEPSETYVNVVFFDFESASNPRCKDSDYYIREDVCNNGKMYRFLEKKEHSRCFTPINFEFVKFLHHCPCSFEKFYWLDVIYQSKLEYENIDNYCKPKTNEIDTSLNCNNGKFKLSHMNGIRKILDGKCEYDFSKDDDKNGNNNCGYLDDPDYLKIILNTTSVTVYMDKNGKHYSRSPIYIENLIESFTISNIWDYDINEDILYFANRRTIFMVENVDKSNSHKINELYVIENEITGMIYDYSSESLFVSDNISNAYQISLKSNYMEIYPLKGIIISFNKIIRTISYLVGQYQICTQVIYQNSKCITFIEPLVYGYLDFESEISFILYSNNSLVVQKGINNSQKITEIKDVYFIRIIDYSLYFLSKTTIYFIDIKFPSLYYKIADIDTSNVTFLFVRDLYKNIPYKSLNCYYINEVNNRFEGKCACPTGAILYENSCECTNNIVYQKSLCLGYFCKNKKCLKNNIRCNRINDCGDDSDENGCTKKCRSDEHLCNNICEPKSKICQEPNIKSNIKSCEINKISTIKYLLVSILVIAIVFGFIIFKFKYYPNIKLLKIRNQVFHNICTYKRNSNQLIFNM